MSLQRAYPPEVATSLADLLQLEGLAASHQLLPDRPVYSILAGRHSSKLRGRGLDFEEVRPYVAGDDIRNIDWRVTARTGETHSKVHNEEKERPVLILLDQSSRMFFGSQRYMKSVSAAHAAALSAFYTLKRGDRVGGIIFSEEGHDFVPPRRNRESLLYFLQAIVKWNTRLPLRKAVNPPAVAPILHSMASLSLHDHVVTFIGDCASLDISAKQELKALNAHNDVILVHIYDAFEERLPEGKILLTDGNRQLRWNNQERDNDRSWRNHFCSMRTALRAEFANTRIPLLFLHTAAPVDQQIKDQLWNPGTDN